MCRIMEAKATGPHHAITTFLVADVVTCAAIGPHSALKTAVQGVPMSSPAPDRAAFLAHLGQTLTGIEADGLYKRERLITSAQGTWVGMQGSDRKVLNLCANNYLGLADHPALIAAAKQAMDEHGYGMASVRFICGTQDLHRQLEERIARFLGMDDSILFAACFDANGGLFEPLLTEKDAIISDSLNHASIIDGVRLSKAKRYRYANNDMSDLEVQLLTAVGEGARFILIATDGVFSMDGYYANLPAITALASTAPIPNFRVFRIRVMRAV